MDFDDSRQEKANGHRNVVPEKDAGNELDRKIQLLKSSKELEIKVG